MRKLFAIALIVLPFSAFAETINERLDDALNTFMSENNVPATNIGIYIPEKLDWTASVGKANTKAGDDVKLADRFRIGSISKTFTATAILKLVDEGKLSLDDAISKYVAGVPNGDSITIRHLANMTSGLFNYTEDKKFQKELEKNPNRMWRPEELLAISFSKKLMFEPGNGWHYCNTNFVLLGLVVEKLSGVSLHEYIANEILSPNGMSNTFSLADFSLPEPRAHGYTQYSPKGKILDVTDNNSSWGYATGHMVSDFEDLKRWAVLIGKGELYSESSNKARMTWVKPKGAPDSKRYGLGLGNNNGWLMHMGTMPGYNAIFAYHPKYDATFVVLVNSDMDVKTGKKTNEPAHALFKLVASLVTPDAVPVD